MSAGFASVTEEDGVLVTSAVVNGFRLAELRFPPACVQERFEPELPYLAVVLDGALEKSFSFRTMHLGAESALTMPVGAAHAACFGRSGARVMIVMPTDASSPVAACLDRLSELRGRGYSWLAWRLAGELRASDTAAPLAAEGLALELLAASSRDDRTERRGHRTPAWLSAAEDLLHAGIGECIALSDLADAVGVHPAHLARTFRARHGVSVGEYGRRIRVEWAATALASSDTPVAVISARAGFADQSHFTRLFKRYVGITPARYREETQRGSRGVARTAFQDS